MMSVALFGDDVLNKIIEKSNFNLDGKEDVAQGIVFPQDFINKSSQLKLGNTFKIGEGIFGLSEEEKLDSLYLSLFFINCEDKNRTTFGSIY
mgnify:CR=1 FL=1